MMVTRAHVDEWMSKMKTAWEERRPDDALALFRHTEEYYERPFKPGTTQEEYHGYWAGIVDLEDIVVNYNIVAVEGDVACVHWDNLYTVPGDPRRYHLDGMYVIEFDQSGNCRVFRQWWFME